MTKNDTPSFPVAGPGLTRATHPSAEPFSAAGPVAVIVVASPVAADAEDPAAHGAALGTGPR